MNEAKSQAPAEVQQQPSLCNSRAVMTQQLLLLHTY